MCVCVCVSLSTLVKISKNAGALLRPHISLLVISLLESVTTLEPQTMNYLSLHAAANQAAADKVLPVLSGLVWSCPRVFLFLHLTAVYQRLSN